MKFHPLLLDSNITGYLIGAIVCFFIGVFLTRWIFSIDKQLRLQEDIHAELVAIRQALAPSTSREFTPLEASMLADKLQSLKRRRDAGDMSEEEFYEAKKALGL